MGEQRARECHARKSFTVQARRGERGVCDRHRQKTEHLWGGLCILKVRVSIANTQVDGEAASRYAVRCWMEALSY